MSLKIHVRNLKHMLWRLYNQFVEWEPHLLMSTSRTHDFDSKLTNIL